MNFKKIIIISILLVAPLAPLAAHAATIRAGSTNGLVGYWSFDEGTSTRATDFSGKGNNGVLSGTTKPTWVAGKHGGALSFDGSNDIGDLGRYVNVGNSASLNVFSAFTISAWVKSSNIAGTQTIVGKYDNTVAGSSYLLWLSVGETAVRFYTNNGVGSETLIGTKNVKNGVWHFVTATWDGTTKRLYIDGVADGTPSTPTSVNSGAGATNTYIGSTVSGIKNFLGSIDDVRIYNRALSAAEVYKLYKSGETVINKIPVVRLNKGLVGYWPFDGNTVVNGAIQDKSGNNNTGYPTNIATSTFYTAGKIGQGVRFDGVNDYVNAGSNSNLNLTGTVTLSAWVKPSVGIGQQGIIGNVNGNSVAYSLYLRHSAGADIGCQINPNGNVYYPSSYVGTVNYGQWNHVVCIFDGSKLLNYLNGVNVPLTTTSLLTAKNFGNVYLGYSPGISSPMYLNGSLDDVRVYSRALNPAEVKALYKMGQATINKTPVNRLTQGLVGYWTFDGKDITNGRVNDVSGNGNNGFPTNISTSTFYTAGKIGQGVRFDGVNDYVDLRNKFSSSEGSFSIWVNPSASLSGASTRCILTQNASTNGWPNGLYYVSGSLYFRIYSGATYPAFYTTTLSANTWYHLLGVWGSNGIKLYVNGIPQGTTNAFSGAMTSNTQNALVSACSDASTVNSFFSGKTDDVRIYNRALSAGEVKQLYNMGR